MNKLLSVVPLFAAWFAAGALAHAARVPSAVGIYYPSRPAELSALADRLMAVSTVSVPGDVIALLVPHAGLEFTGKAAAQAYRLSGEYDSILVVGAGHFDAIEGAALYPGAYADAEGAIPYDELLGKALLSASPLIKGDARAHEKDYSIEVQLPLLRRRWPKARLAALLMNTQDLETSRAVGKAIAQAAKGRRLLIVASSDLSHYPDGVTADAVDSAALSALGTLDPAFFWRTNRFLLNRDLPHLKVTQCGEGALTAVMIAASVLGADRFFVTARLNSGDVVSERTYDHVVGHAAGAFTRTGRPVLSLVLTEEEKGALLDLAAGVLAGRAPRVPLPPQARLNLPIAVTVRLEDAAGNLLAESGSQQAEETLIEAVVRHTAAAAKKAGKRRPKGLTLELRAPLAAVLSRAL